MIDFNSIFAVSHRLRAYWRQEQLFRDINALSPELRKDIGWPSGVANPGIENMRWHAGQANLGSMR